MACAETEEGGSNVELSLRKVSARTLPSNSYSSAKCDDARLYREPLQSCKTRVRGEYASSRLSKSANENSGVL